MSRNGRPSDFSTTFSGTDTAVRETLKALRRFLEAEGVSRDDCGTAEIVLAEVLNNVFEHAYGPDTAGEVALTARLYPAKIIVDIRDSGRPLPGLELPTGEPPALDQPRGGLPEGGFGWYMIRRLTADLVYARHGAQNRLQFTIPLSRG